MYWDEYNVSWNSESKHWYISQDCFGKFRKQKMACRVQTEKAQLIVKGNVMIPNKSLGVCFHKKHRGVSIEEVPGDDKEFCRINFPERWQRRWFEFDGIQRGEAESSRCVETLFCEIFNKCACCSLAVVNESTDSTWAAHINTHYVWRKQAIRTWFRYPFRARPLLRDRISFKRYYVVRRSKIWKYLSFWT
jgi:hypothetical protein